MAYIKEPSSTFLASLAYAAIQAEKWDTARNLYRSLTAIHPEKFNFKMNYLNCCIQTGKYEEGLDIAQKLAGLNPKSVDIQKKLAYLYRLTKKAAKQRIDVLVKAFKKR